MDNIFLPKEDGHYQFKWHKLGDIAEGRPNIGNMVPVAVYRLLEYSVNNVLFDLYGAEQANEIFRKAGYLAAVEFAHNCLPLETELDEFLLAVQDKLLEYKIGIFRVEKADLQTGEFIVTVYEDLDCSGLPSTHEVVCNYDEGFIAGILEAYFGKKFEVREIDCWSKGDRVCRFRGSWLDDSE